MKIDRNVWFILPMRSVLFVVIFLCCSIMTRNDLADITHWWSIIASVVNLVTIIILWEICKHGGMSYRKLIHYEKKQGNILRGFYLFLLCCYFLLRQRLRRRESIWVAV